MILKIYLGNFPIHSQWPFYNQLNNQKPINCKEVAGTERFLCFPFMTLLPEEYCFAIPGYHAWIILTSIGNSWMAGERRISVALRPERIYVCRK